MNYPIQIGDTTIDNPTAFVAMIVNIQTLYTDLKTKYNNQAVQLANHELRISALEGIIADLQTKIAQLQVEKADKTELLTVEDVKTGNDANVATIESIRRELDLLSVKTLQAGDTNPLMDIESCILKPTPIKVLSFALDKGLYALDGTIHHNGLNESRGELYFEIGGVEVAKSVVTFSGDGNAPISTLIDVTADNTEVKLMAKRVSGLNLDIISNQRVKSYARWIRIS